MQMALCVSCNLSAKARPTEQSLQGTENTPPSHKMDFE